MTDDSGVRAIIYELKEDPNFAVFDRDMHGEEALWDEYTPVAWWSPKMPRLSLISREEMTTS